jgi:hypothetical protein
MALKKGREEGLNLESQATGHDRVSLFTCQELRTKALTRRRFRRVRDQLRHEESLSTVETKLGSSCLNLGSFFGKSKSWMLTLGKRIDSWGNASRGLRGEDLRRER